MMISRSETHKRKHKIKNIIFLIFFVLFILLVFAFGLLHPSTYRSVIGFWLIIDFLALNFILVFYNAQLATISILITSFVIFVLLRFPYLNGPFSSAYLKYFIEYMYICLIISNIALVINLLRVPIPTLKKTNIFSKLYYVSDITGYWLGFIIALFAYVGLIYVTIDIFAYLYFQYQVPKNSNIHLIFTNSDLFTGDHKFADTWSESKYFSTVTFFTIGYGDIVPNNDKLRNFAQIEMYIGHVLNAFYAASLLGLFLNTLTKWTVKQPKNILRYKKSD